MVIYIVQEMDINLVEEEGIVVEAEMVEYGEVVVVVDMVVKVGMVDCMVEEAVEEVLFLITAETAVMEELMVEAEVVVELMVRVQQV